MKAARCRGMTVVTVLIACLAVPGVAAADYGGSVSIGADWSYSYTFTSNNSLDNCGSANDLDSYAPYGPISTPAGTVYQYTLYKGSVTIVDSGWCWFENTNLYWTATNVSADGDGTVEQPSPAELVVQQVPGSGLSCAENCDANSVSSGYPFDLIWDTSNGDQALGPPGVHGRHGYPPTRSEVVAGLAREIAPRGSGARIGLLLRRGVYAFSFAAPGAGRMTLRWWSGSAAPKPFLVASGSQVFARDGNGQLTVRLTPSGRRLLDHAKRLTLIAKGSFTFSSPRQAASANRSFTLTR